MQHSQAVWHVRALALVLPCPLLANTAAGAFEDMNASGQPFGAAADQTALLLLAFLLSTYSAFVALGWLLWRRARRPRAPHHELIANVEEAEATVELPSQSGFN